MGCTSKKAVGKWVTGKQTALTNRLTVKHHVQPNTAIKAFSSGDYILLSKITVFSKGQNCGLIASGQYYLLGDEEAKPIEVKQ